MHAHILTEFDPSVYRRFGLPTAEHFLVLRVGDTYWDSVYKKLKEHVAKNDKRIMSGQEPFKLEVKIDIDYRHRSLSANAWLWAMHTIEASIINGKTVPTKWQEADDVTPEMVHEDYMDRFAPRAEIVVEEWMVAAIGETARIISQEPMADGKVKLCLMKSSSYMNVREFAALAHEVERQMVGYGISLDHYLEYQKLSDQVPEFDKAAEKEAMPKESDNQTKAAPKPKSWHEMTRAEQAEADPERFDREMQLDIF